eukprot:756902-Amphidinium_carterae.2
MRKYVDDMLLVAAGPYFAHYLRDSYRSGLRALTDVNMQVNHPKVWSCAMAQALAGLACRPPPVGSPLGTWVWTPNGPLGATRHRRNTSAPFIIQ